MKARIFAKVLIIHVVIIGFFVVSSLVKNWFKPDPIPVMDVTLVVDPLASKSTAVKAVEQPEKPTPKPPVPPPEKPPPEKPPPEKVEKPKSKLKTADQIQVNKKAVKRRTDVKKVEPKPVPVKKRVPTDWEKKFELVANSSEPVVDTRAVAAAASPDALARFESMLAARLKQQWARPAAWPGGGAPMVVISVRVSRSGQVSQARVVKASPYQALNNSALLAAQGVTRISGVPRGFPVSKEYLIDYVLQQ